MIRNRNRRKDRDGLAGPGRFPLRALLYACALLCVLLPGARTALAACDDADLAALVGILAANPDSGLFSGFDFRRPGGEQRLRDADDAEWRANGVVRSDGTVRRIVEIRWHDRHIERLDASGLTALETLVCAGTGLRTLDASGLRGLRELHCDNNALAELDVRGLSALRILTCGDNALTELRLADGDGANAPAALEELACMGNRLRTLALPALPELVYLDCADNNLATLDVGRLPALQSLQCGANPLRALDLRGLPALTNVDAAYCFLESLDLRPAARLEHAAAYGNPLREVSLGGLRNLSLFLSLPAGGELLLRTDAPDLAAAAPDAVSVAGTEGAYRVSSLRETPWADQRPKLASRAFGLRIHIATHTNDGD